MLVMLTRIVDNDITLVARRTLLVTVDGAQLTLPGFGTILTETAEDSWGELGTALVLAYDSPTTTGDWVRKNFTKEGFQ